MEQRNTRVIASRVGKVAVDPASVLTFPHGLIGFERLRDFVLVDFKPGTPFRYLQSLERAEVGFLVADPFAFLGEYRIQVGSAEERILKVRSVRELVVLVLVTVPKGRPEDTSLNLMGPLCLNVRERIGLQVPQAGMRPARVLLRDCGGESLVMARAG
ncbi:MAG TPA: flagellar assembly protein FliW [Desulfomicrobiaceae bacterium]|nr:flagellar assembly protein FliW [Desulfomicrobiaceae bacterium]